ncbi:MAG TPA: U32 family peptidase [Bacilli bacterium]|nr:U32 family peptidase [Bacilli bacterium]
MSKLITDYTMAKDLKLDVSGFIINFKPYSLFPKYRFSLEEVKVIIPKIRKENKLVFLNIDALIREKDLENLKELLKIIITLDFDYLIFHDFAIYNYFKENGLENKLIYDGKTMVTSKNELEFFKKQNLSVFVSRELKKDELAVISKLDNALLEVFGFERIFYSKRPILSLFKEFKNIDEKLTNKVYKLKEKDDLYLAYEEDGEYFVYLEKIKYLYNELKDLKNNFKYLKISQAFIEDITYVIDKYNDLLNDKNLEKNSLFLEKYVNEVTL